MLTLKMPSSLSLCTSSIGNISRLSGFKTFTNSWVCQMATQMQCVFLRKPLSLFLDIYGIKVKISAIFVDDSCLQGGTKQECIDNINPTID